MRKIIILFLVLCMLTGCVVAQPVATEPTAATKPTATEPVEVESMAYSNVTFPTIPELNWGDYPYRIVYLVYNPLEEDWIAAHLIVSDYPFYYDIEKNSISTDGLWLRNLIHQGENWSTNREDWDGWEGTVDWIVPGLWFAAIEDTDMTPLTDHMLYSRIWTYYAIDDTEGNQWLAANSITPVTVFPEGVEVTPEREIVVKQGQEHQIQCAVTHNGVTLDPMKYTWIVLEPRRVNGVLGFYVTDDVMVDRNGLVTVTTKTATTKAYWIFVLDDILSTQDLTAWILRTEAFNLQSFLIGYTLGIAGKPLPLNTKREPVAYLYNGVRLPKLPEWDREMYPYAFIRYVETEDYYRFFAFAQRPYASTKYGLLQVRYTGDYFYTCFGEYCNATEDWREPVEHTYSSTQSDPDNSVYVWADFDIINEDDNSVFFGKCPDPIPVYE